MQQNPPTPPTAATHWEKRKEKTTKQTPPLEGLRWWKKK